VLLKLYFAGFGVRIALHTHGAAGAFPGPRIGLRPLPTYRQSTTMADTPIAIDGLQTLQVGLQLAAKIPLNEDLAAVDRLNDQIQLLGRKVFCTNIGIDVREFEDLLCVLRSDSINIRKRGLNSFVAGDVYSKDTWHGIWWWVVKIGGIDGAVSALPLFVTGVFANHADDIVSPHNFAAFAKAFD